MCLIELFPENKINKILNHITEDEITVYKVVKYRNKKYFPLMEKRIYPYNSGMNEADTSISLQTTRIVKDVNCKCSSGFHFFMNDRFLYRIVEDCNDYRKTMEYCNLSDENIRYRVIKCKIKKEWIITMGEDTIGFKKNHKKKTTVVTTKAIFPDSYTEEIKDKNE